VSTFDAEYKKRLTSPEMAVDLIGSGATIVVGMSNAEPPALLEAIAARVRADAVKGLNVYTMSPMAHLANTLFAPDLCDCIQVYSWFVGPPQRGLIKTGINYYIPNYFHQVPRLCSEFMQIDATISVVSPMDKAGYFSFGLANDYTSTVIRHSRRRIVEVNRNMPRVFGDSLLHVSEVDAIVENTVPLLEVIPAAPKPEDDVIGKLITEMIPDGATIQLGVGGIPNTVAGYLLGHKDLGIHTEVFCPGMVDLIEKGAVNGSKKTLHPRKSVFTFARGTKALFDFLDDNPAVESYPVSHINDPAVIAMNDVMISVNSVIEVDLLGQCNSEYLDGSQFSGTGGQLDYVRGAFNSRGGRSILAFYATAKDGAISRVVPRLKSGTVVTTPRMDTHYLATEYGVVNLKGKSSRDRALEIISIAHPKFRDDLLREAENMYLL
jgi:itaconate CoA-transferase